MQELDPDGAGLTLPELRKATGQSRERLIWALTWLVETGAAEMKLDERKRKLWHAALDDGGKDQLPFTAPPGDLTDYSAFEGLLSSLQ
jgi:hypothetical protein